MGLVSPSAPVNTRSHFACAVPRAFLWRLPLRGEGRFGFATLLPKIAEASFPISSHQSMASAMHQEICLKSMLNPVRNFRNEEDLLKVRQRRTEASLSRT